MVSHPGATFFSSSARRLGVLENKRLALAEERRGMLVDAERETEASLRLSPGQADARNLLGVIYAEEGKAVRASQTWHDLIRDVPSYQPARANLSMLSSRNNAADAETAAAVPTSPATIVRISKK